MYGLEAFSTLMPTARALWAKSGELSGHGLLAHLLDVAAVAETLLEVEPDSTLHWASAQLGLPFRHATRWIAAIVGLHDFGKGIPGFQAKWEAGMDADQAVGLQFSAAASNATDHALATAALLGPPLHALAGTDVLWLRQAIQAISAHHGYHYLSDEINSGRPKGEPTEWGQARRTVLEAYWDALAPEGRPSREELTLPAVNWLAGLTSTSDWIASNPDWFPLGERCDDLHTYYEDAKRRALDALHGIGWERHRTLLTVAEDTGRLLGRIIGREQLAPRPLQEAGDRLLATSQGPALLLVEAPMGEGKTELAFLAHLRLQASNGHRGLYVALPTQATGNALFKRALTFLEQFVEDHADVQLVHGGAAMNEDVRHLRGIDHSSYESLSASAWFSQRKRPLLSPYGIGTVDQALFAILNVKHHFVRLWGLGNRVVVLDEVHAYDTYTSGLIAVLLRWLKAMGCSVVLMSATLPQTRRAELLRAWDLPGDTMPELAYPRLVLADRSGMRGEHFSARPLSPIELAGLGEGLEELAERVAELAAGGGCGALVVNTVDRAQKLYMLLRSRLDNDVVLLLFHARYPADERAERERQVLAMFGPDGERPSRALLVATQVVEQSLDIDFDYMCSDLAPVDLLLQRAGRLHRHPRQRLPSHAQACLWVAGLQPGRPPELKETAWGFVYDAYVLGRTWALLRRERTLHMPGDIDRLVQVVYGDDPLPEDTEEAMKDLIEVEAYGEYLARMQKERREAVNIAIDPDLEPQRAYDGKPRGNEDGDGIGLENRTRLGPESITLVPVEADGDGWRVRPGETSFAPDRPLDDAMARRLYNRQLKISKVAVVRHFKGQERPASFSEHPLLRNSYPMPMQQRCYEAGSLRLMLDAELGLVYESSKETNEEPA